MPKLKKNVEVTEAAPEVSKDELIAAALNTPDEVTVTIGGKKFQLMDFKYKEHIAFLRYLEPMFDLFLGSGQRLGPTLTSGSILTFCADDLPRMALMVANKTYPDMTEDELLDIAPSPFELADLVIAQIAHNKIIERLSGFLQLMGQKKTM